MSCPVLKMRTPFGRVSIRGLSVSRISHRTRNGRGGDTNKHFRHPGHPHTLQTRSQKSVGPPSGEGGGGRGLVITDGGGDGREMEVEGSEVEVGGRWRWEEGRWW